MTSACLGDFIQHNDKPLWVLPKRVLVRKEFKRVHQANGTFFHFILRQTLSIFTCKSIYCMLSLSRHTTEFCPSHGLLFAFGKNASSALAFLVMDVSSCVAATELCVFRCAASAAHFFRMLGIRNKLSPVVWSQVVRITKNQSRSCIYCPKEWLEGNTIPSSDSD